jgi:hypothetical protein
MTHRQRVKDIFRTGFWLGNPDPERSPGLLRHLGATDEEAARRKLNDDFRWFMAGTNRRTMNLSIDDQILEKHSKTHEKQPASPRHPDGHSPHTYK